MKYRRFGTLDWDVSVLGFGCMRLPTKDGRGYSEQVEERESIALIRRAIDRGVNYVDTAYPYHGGQSEIVLGKALQDGYRSKVRLATKSPVWLIQKPEDFDLYLREQLDRLQAEHIDFYLLHSLNSPRWPSILKFDVLRRAEAAVRDGRIGHIGFSFHDDFELFKKIVDAYPGWEFCQIQYNYMDIENQAGTAGLRYAAAKGLAVVVMEPLLGGRLANPPAAVARFLGDGPARRSPVDLALQWLWNQPEVATVLSGMGAMSQVEDNLRSAERAAVGSLTAEESALIERLRRAYLDRAAIPCTKCDYCMPCPNGVNIPRNFELYNDAIIHDDPTAPRFTYGRFLEEKERASACIQCRECEGKCPQSIEISDWMPKVHETLGKPPGAKS
jgi:predicted aldo/keto reductase-like oxidoreductase